MPADPEFPFGAGGSYTRFELRGLTAEPAASIGGTWRTSTIVENTGSRDGTATVQLYARVNAFGVTRPAAQLIGFARVDVAAGESRQVEFTVDSTQFGFTGLDHQFAVETGTVDYFLGFDSADRRQTGSFDLAGERRILKASDRVFFAEVDVRRP
jgi:beta-glucosidase